MPDGQVGHCVLDYGTRPGYGFGCLSSHASQVRFGAWRIEMRPRFVFRIKTKSGGIIGNIVIEAKDQYEAEHKLKHRYPDCEILNCELR